VSEKKSFVCVHEDEAIVKKKIRKTFFSKLKLKVPWENQLKEEQKKVLRAFFLKIQGYIYPFVFT